jgi:glucose-6-phosphate 1-epimerase
MSLTLPAGICETQLGAGPDAPGLSALLIENTFCRATVTLQGAQLLAFTPQGGRPLLWLSERAMLAPGKAVRGGIPLCFPWFGPHPDDAAKPAHGFARNRLWQLEAARAAADGGHVLRLALEDDAATRALWPHAFRAELELQLGRQLQLQLTVSNRDPQPVSFSFALHSYFPVGDIAQVGVQGLDGVPYIDQLEPSRALRVQQGDIKFVAETDRIYLGAAGHYRIVEADRVLTVTAENCHSAIVWNPWQEKTTRLADMAGDAWRRMLCVECGNAESDRVTLGAGESRRFALRIA